MTILPEIKKRKIEERNELRQSTSTKSTLTPVQALLLFFSVRDFRPGIPSYINTGLELSRLLSKDSIEGLWWGIVGMTDQWISKKILNSQYTDNVWKFSLHDHSMR